MSDETRRIEINWIQSIAGALAAVTSAVLLSTVGVAGTLIGAALGSLAATIGNAVYSHYLKATRDRVAAAQTIASARIGLAQRRVQEVSAGAAAGRPGAQEELAEAEEDLERAQAVLEEADPDPAPEGWRAALAGLPWKRIALGTAGLFVVAMLLILAFELVSGRAVSTYTGGTDGDRRTSISGLVGGGSATEPRERGPQAPTDEATPGRSDEEELLIPEDQPTTQPTAATTQPTPGSTPTTAEPTPTPTPTPTPASAPALPTPTTDGGAGAATP